MNCQEALKLFYDIIDKEASDIDTEEVKKHLEGCSDCFNKFHLESSVHAFINAKINESKEAPARLDDLRSKICSKLDAVDGEDHKSEDRRPFRVIGMTLAAAATLVIMVAAAYFVSDLVRHSREYLPLEQAHFAASANPSAYATANPTSALLASVHDNLSYSLSPSVDGFKMVGGTTEEIMGVQMSHFVYTNNGSTVSVFVIPSDQFDIPADLKSHPILKDNQVFFDHHCHSCRLVYHETNKAVIVTSTEDNSVDLLDFIPGSSAI